MKLMNLASILLIGLFIAISEASFGWGGGGGEKVLLRDIQTLTLYDGKMTSGRRSSPVPQLNCVGGTAGCKTFTPKVVQCYNRGWDGDDVQWECKSDMDNDYRFGNIQVTCEGFDYSQDPYVLKGSCGLEYTLDLTKEGNARYQQNNYGYQSSYSTFDQKHGHGQGFGQNLMVIIVVCILIYAFYKTCIEPTDVDRVRSRTNQDYPPDDGGRRAPPPSYGFRNDYTQNSGDSCGPSSRGYGGGGGGGAGGFWTGLGTGGLLGYMFGNRNNGNQYYANQGFGSGFGTRYRAAPTPSTSWGGGGGSSWGGGASTSGSSGTRTASGFGGTSRR